ncbi:MAG TPA: type II toxin-antitoxin system RelE/ParE family toxin [Chitinophagaceae bacterium]|nr:type II toxin-antitoxin system RelE/ParE family toxin [Chitinophagaceae bacterium]
MPIEIKWSKLALKKFDEAIKRIELDSPVSAEKIRRRILLAINGLLQHPEKFNPDKYKTGNDGSYRAFELYHYRISYRYKKETIRIIRVRHTRMNPLEY